MHNATYHASLRVLRYDSMGLEPDNRDKEGGGDAAADENEEESDDRKSDDRGMWGSRVSNVWIDAGDIAYCYSALMCMYMRKEKWYLHRFWYWGRTSSGLDTISRICLLHYAYDLNLT